MCDKCNKKVVTCNCPMKLSTDCINHEGGVIIPIGAVRGDSLTTVIEKISEKLQELKLGIENSSLATNIGVGQNVYKGKNRGGIDEFRSLKEGEGIDLIQTSENINIAVDEKWLSGYLKDYINEQWFEQHFKDIVTQSWFVDYFKGLMLEPWFKDVLNHLLDQEWFSNKVVQILQQQTTINTLTAMFNQQWFKDNIKRIVNEN